MQAAIRLVTKHGVGVLITDHNIQDTLRFVDHAYIIESHREESLRRRRAPGS
jgi:ABC-type lipopolysaccharide export system ATPase subunit